MTDSKDWVLPSGGTFLACTAGSYGSWAKATDPVTAARDAARSCSSNYPQFVQVWYCPTNRTSIAGLGNLSWYSEDADKIVPIGFFKLTRSTMTASKDERLTHEDFQEDWCHRLKMSHEAHLEEQRDSNFSVTQA